MDPETFLIELYVLADEFAKTQLPHESHPGPAAALDRSEVLTLAVLSQWARFSSERDFWRYAGTRLRPYFPRLPSRSQFNRQLRRQHTALSAFALWLAARLDAAAAPYEALDGTAVPIRNAKRRGLGWLPGVADIGKCLRRGWIEGLRLLVCTTPEGTVTGWGWVRPAPVIGHWPRRSWRSGRSRSRRWLAPARSPAASMSPTVASPERRTRPGCSMRPTPSSSPTPGRQSPSLVVGRTTLGRGAPANRGDGHWASGKRVSPGARAPPCAERLPGTPGRQDGLAQWLSLAQSATRTAPLGPRRAVWLVKQRGGSHTKRCSHRRSIGETRRFVRPSQ